jgi:hypothetical protein
MGYIYHGGMQQANRSRPMSILRNKLNGESNQVHLAPMREIIRSRELGALGSVVVKGAMGSHETTGAGGAEV